ncbi:MAG: glycoside hydrolase family 99-like domain-containing protein [Planctomycetota bacterium]
MSAEDQFYRFPKPSGELAWTGERYVSQVEGQIQIEHHHRYLFAAQFCAGKRVLDIASGEGFGAALMSREADRVIGMDASEEAVAFARREYGGPRVSFEVGRCESIPLPEDSIDVVVSFETIEHIAEQERFLDEVRRVLAPGGLFICSTPDRDVYSEHESDNPYHLRELTREEFEGLLGARFERSRVMSQRLVCGSWIIDADGKRSEQATFETEGDGVYRRRDGLGTSPYLIAVASDEKLPHITGGGLNHLRYSAGWQDELRRKLTDSRDELREARKQSVRAHGELDRQRKLAEASRGHAETLKAESANLSDRVRELQKHANAQREAINELRVQSRAGREALERVLRDRDRQLSSASAEAVAERRRIATLEAALKDARSARGLASAQAEATAAEVGALEAAVVSARRDASEARARQAAGATALSELEAMRQRMGAMGIRKAAWLSLRRRYRQLTQPMMRASRLDAAERAIRSSGLFDVDYYLAHNADVAQAGIDPLRHFVEAGCDEGRRPCAWFDPAFYRAHHRDVSRTGVNVFAHYATHGRTEGRLPSGESLAPLARVQDRRAAVSAPAVSSPGPEPIMTAATSIHVPSESRPVPSVQLDREQAERTRVLAFYLPQFHPVAENDAWWGRGFTEWSNVTRATPRFAGHKQPMLPGELGFYDLRLPEVREQQAELARAHGIGGFCFYYYWFNGRKLLERPIESMLASGEPSFPFCICWANENWTRRWDGLEREVLLAQNHTLEADRRFILDVIPILGDDRYIRVDDRPVLLVYRADMLSDAAEAAEVWRDECRRAGLGEIHLCAVRFRTDDPRPLGFDAAVEFPPHHFPAPNVTSQIAGVPAGYRGGLMDLGHGARDLIARPPRLDYRMYRGVMPAWDNTARRGDHSTVFLGSSPELYKSWLRSAINYRQPEGGPRENLVFVNAWNEWAEGALLEPTRAEGRMYLRATAEALGITPPDEPLRVPPVVLGDAAPQQVQSAGATAEKPVTPEATSAPQQDDAPAPRALDERLKAVVRRSPALTSFAYRHHDLSKRVLNAVRRVQPAPGQSAGQNGHHPDIEPKPAANGATPARDRGPARWREPGGVRVEGRTPAIFVTHDAARAGSQLLLLEIVRHVAERGVYEPHVIMLGGGEVEPEFYAAARCLNVEEEARKRGSNAAGLEAVLNAAGAISPAYAVCASAVSSPAAKGLRARGVPVVSLINELVTSMEAAYGAEKVPEAIASSDYAVCVSEFARDAMVSAFDLPGDKVGVLPPGYLPHRSTEGRDEEIGRAFRRAHGLDEDSRLVIGCGTVHPRKAPDLFIQLASRYGTIDGATPTNFVWIGSGAPADVRWAQHDLEASGLGDRCRFIGAVPDVGPAFAACDVLALTSREDPYPLVMLEALSRGKPVLCFEGAGGAPEAVERDAGAVVPYLDVPAMAGELHELFRDGGAYGRVSDAARTKAERRFGFDRYTDQLMDIAERLVRERSAKPVGASS